MLVPLCGDAETGAPKDGDAGVRRALAEAVLALAATDAGRGALWGVAAPEALRRAYEDEEDEGVCDALEQTAAIFIEGAGAVEEVEEGGKEGAPADGDGATAEA
jgi:hypothetical protein